MALRREKIGIAIIRLPYAPFGDEGKCLVSDEGQSPPLLALAILRSGMIMLLVLQRCRGASNPILSGMYSQALTVGREPTVSTTTSGRFKHPIGGRFAAHLSSRSTGVGVHPP